MSVQRIYVEKKTPYAVEAKQLLLDTDVPRIVARGRKGGSNVAAAICNALLYQIRR